jgi:TPR repeat protein
MSVNTSSSFSNAFHLFEQKKAEKKPLALILTGERDHNGSLHCHSTNFFLSTLQKTHEVVHQTIREKSDIRKQIESTSKLHHRSIQMLVFKVHGSSQNVLLGKEERYSSKDVSSKDFPTPALDSKAEILMYTCKAGADKGLAERIAEKTNRVVFAASDVMDAERTCIYYCNHHKLFEMASYNDEGKQHVRKFQENKLPQKFYCCKGKQTQYVIDQKDYLKKLSDKGDDKASIELGDLYFLERKWKKAEDCYQKAALNGNGAALCSLGVVSVKKRDLKSAKEFFLKSIDQGEYKGLCLLGAVCEDLQESDEAKKYYKKAADLGDVRAERGLGLLFKKEKDFGLAEYWLKRSAKKRDVEARYELGLYYEENGDWRKAEFYYRKAAKLNFSDSEQKLSSLRQKMKRFQSEIVETLPKVFETTRWCYLDSNAKSSQPLSQAEFKKKILEGSLSPSTKVWNEGFCQTDWLSLQEFVQREKIVNSLSTSFEKFRWVHIDSFGKPSKLMDHSEFLKKVKLGTITLSSLVWNEGFSKREWTSLKSLLTTSLPLSKKQFQCALV